jgi:hypothetical protein
MEAASHRLLRNDDFKFALTFLKNECIQDFKQIDATPEQICEAHQRYVLADELYNRIKTYGRTTDR